MTSQPRKQTISIHILRNISLSKDNQKMKFAKVIEYNMRNILLKKSCGKCGKEKSFEPLLVFKIALYDVKASGLLISFNISIVLNLGYNKNKLYKTLDYWSWDILNFDFFEKSKGIVFPPHFVYDFPRKIFLMPYSTNWPTFIVWLPLLLKILVNVCIPIVC